MLFSNVTSNFQTRMSAPGPTTVSRSVSMVWERILVPATLDTNSIRQTWSAVYVSWFYAKHYFESLLLTKSKIFGNFTSYPSVLKVSNLHLLVVNMNSHSFPKKLIWFFINASKWKHYLIWEYVTVLYSLFNYINWNIDTEYWIFIFIFWDIDIYYSFTSTEILI